MCTVRARNNRKYEWNNKNEKEIPSHIDEPGMNIVMLG